MLFVMQDLVFEIGKIVGNPDKLIAVFKPSFHEPGFVDRVRHQAQRVGSQDPLQVGCHIDPFDGYDVFVTHLIGRVQKATASGVVFGNIGQSDVAQCMAVVVAHQLNPFGVVVATAPDGKGLLVFEAC